MPESTYLTTHELSPRIKSGLRIHRARAEGRSGARAHPPRAAHDQNAGERAWCQWLRHPGRKSWRRYQMQHTAATLPVASRAAPERITRLLGPGPGHAHALPLFDVCSRFMPEATGGAGSAIDGLLGTRLAAGASDRVRVRVRVRDDDGGVHGRTAAGHDRRPVSPAPDAPMPTG